MYIKLEKEQAKRFTYFTKEKEINGVKVGSTEKIVFGTLSEGIKTGENNGHPIWENDYWDASFCGKAYQKALELEDKTRISITEMNIRNVYSKNTKKAYPQIMVTEFEVLEPDQDTSSLESEMPFKN